MAKKRISNVPNPLGSSYEDQVSAIRNLMRSQDKISKLRIMGLDKDKIGQTSKQMEQEVSNRQKSVKQVIPPSSRGPVKDLMGNPLRPSSKPMQGSPQMRNRTAPAIYPKAPDKLSGRTPDAGTKSILDGMKNFMKSGAQGAFKGRLGGGGGGRPGTRL